MSIGKILDSKAVRSAIAFQIMWFVLILFPTMISLFSVFVYLLFHRVYISNDNVLWLISFRVFFIGIMVDSFLFFSNVIIYVPEDIMHNVLENHSSLIPMWLVGLWLCFSLTLPISLVFLRKHYGLCVLFGMIGAPLSYFSGATLRDDVVLMEPIYVSLFYIGAAWSTLLCLAIFWLRKVETTQKDVRMNIESLKSEGVSVSDT